MDDERKLEIERERGQHAAELLDNPIFKDIWTNFEQQIVQQLKISSPRDVDGREKAVLLLQLLHKLRGMVEETVSTGQMAQIQLASKQSRMKELFGWIGRDGLNV